MITEIKRFLNEKYINVPNDWIEACVAFLKEEHNNTNLSLQRFKDLVYEQWLNVDLSQIGSSTLPSHLATSHKTSLNECFALQVNGIRDAGRPAYGQLRQLEGTESHDVEVSAAPKAVLPAWESKPTRMLILNLTDGVTVVQAMEYRPITCLSPNLPAGTKVQISGPLDCRFGMLLLTANNIRVLGGEVEDLSMFSRENMLREALQIEIPNDESSNNNRIAADSNQRNSEAYSYDNVTSDSSSHLPTVRGRPPTFPSGRNSMANAENFESDDDDDFVNSIDYHALDEIEKANSQVPQVVDVEEEMQEDEDMLREMYEYQESANVLMDANGDIEECLPSDQTVATNKRKPIISYDLLSSVDQDKEVTKEFCLTIKGFIVNVLSRLECKSSNGWHLTAKISDNTSAIEADFHDKVLEQLVGMSAKDMMAMQIQARTNTSLKEKMMKAITNCKSKLQQLNCLMEIKFCPGARPCITKCTDYKE